MISGTEILEHLPKDINVRFGKDRYFLDEYGNTKKRKRRAKNSNDEEPILDMPTGWKKKSIFFQLPYWVTLKIRHNLDVMHLEKNVCDNILATLYRIPRNPRMI